MNVLANSVPISWPAVIAACGALITAVSGVFMAYAAVVRARNESIDKADKECLDRLDRVREESETVAEELHSLRMKMKLEEDENAEEAKEFKSWRRRWSHLE